VRLPDVTAGKIAGVKMTATHIAWNSIALLHNVVRTLNYLAALPPGNGGKPLPEVGYCAKVKLHGTNCAVQVHTDKIVTQSREIILTPEADLKGFSKWAHSHEASFRNLSPGITVFGEWCGPGIEKGMAVSALPTKIFAVFAVQLGYGDSASLITDPSAIDFLIAPLGIPGVYVIPWMPGVDFRIDYANKESVKKAADFLNGIVADVEAEDPWIKAVFGVSGVGEGVVLYPVVSSGCIPISPEAVTGLMFKAKGEKHRTVASKEAVQVNPDVLASVDAFVKFAVTPARLEQGVQTACGGTREKRDTPKFIAWILADVQKESVAELEASGLTWAQVEKAVQTRARDWFVGR
jgi:hypothetical protein